MLAFDRIRFRAAPSMPCRPYAGEERQRALSIQREPFRCLARFGVGVLAEGIERRDTAMLYTQSGAPVRTACIANVRDRSTTELRRPWHAPSRRLEFPHAVRHIANDRRGIVRKDAGHRRQIAGSVAHCSSERDDRCLPLGDRVKIAHEELIIADQI
jgi:hypothetical protein